MFMDFLTGKYIIRTVEPFKIIVNANYERLQEWVNEYLELIENEKQYEVERIQYQTTSRGQYSLYSVSVYCKKIK